MLKNSLKCQPMYLIIGDPHFTDRPRDEYRFGLFPWIRKQQLKYKPSATIILGDLCDKKDRHSAKLVNRIVEGIDSLERPIYVLMGNHDYIDPDNPFFKFLNRLDGVEFFVHPTTVGELGFIPHCHDEADFKEAIKAVNGCKVLFLHNTFEGAIAETGAALSGFSMAPLKALKGPVSVFAGDVHRPQQSGPITYVGAPYSVRFGDDFTPRCLLVHGDGTLNNLFFDCPRKWGLTIKSAKELLKNEELLEGDQIKVTLELPREEIVNWKEHKQEVLDACAKLKLEVYGVNMKGNEPVKRDKVYVPISAQQPSDTLAAFCKAEKLATEIVSMGKEFLKG